MSGPLYAQVEPAADNSATHAAPDLEEVTVTATRTGVGTALSAPSPTSIVSSEEIARLGATNISQMLNQIPAFKASLNPASNGARTQRAGAAMADLRGLGPERTLVLIDGMRVVPLAPSNLTGISVSPDMNQVPTLMVERVDVVTGGAAAQWGSDAVSGVVNIVLKNKFSGFEARVQGGESQRGDSRETRLALLGGTDLFDGRGHIVAGVDLNKNDGMGDIYTRGWGREEWQLVSNSAYATNGLPANILSPNVHSALSRGGVISGPASFSLRGYEFLPGGSTLEPFQYGSLVGGQVMIGGEGRSFVDRASLIPAVKRANPYVRMEYELSDSVTAFFAGSFAWTRSNMAAATTRDTNLVVRRDNPFLPTTVVDAMTTANINSFTLSRINFDIHQAQAEITNEAPHGAVGLTGELGDWTWDAHYAVGRNRHDSTTTSTRNNTRFAFATDAVLNNGQIVCRATIAGPSFNAAAAGCVPINLFGEGAPSADAIAYTVGTAHAISVYDQDSAAANLRGEPFSTWAGPVAMAMGLEYRKEQQEVTADAATAAASFAVGNASPFKGQYDVTEGYVEAIVPLADDLPFMKSLDFNGAWRTADYSNVGQQDTWKIGATYEPVDGLRFRATRSVDIRAPALFELYGRGSVTSNTVTTRGFNVVIPVNITTGNPGLKPETSNARTIGVVFEPQGALHGWSASLDYYNINVEDAIAAPSANQIGTLCTLGQQAFCDLITFNPVTGAPTAVNAPVRNAARLQAIGYDFVLSYRASLSDWHSSLPGTLTTNLNGTKVEHMYVDLGTGAGAIDRAGENGQSNAGALPSLRLSLSATYELGPASVTAQVNYISSGKLDNTFNRTPATTINDNDIPSRTYLNLFSTVALNQDKSLELFGAVANVLDRDPPPVPYAAIFAPTNGTYYDVVGRAFQLGLTYRY